MSSSECAWLCLQKSTVLGFWKNGNEIPEFYSVIKKRRELFTHLRLELNCSSLAESWLKRTSLNGFYSRLKVIFAARKDNCFALTIKKNPSQLFRESLPPHCLFSLCASCSHWYVGSCLFSAVLYTYGCQLFHQPTDLQLQRDMLLFAGDAFECHAVISIDKLCHIYYIVLYQLSGMPKAQEQVRPFVWQSYLYSVVSGTCIWPSQNVLASITYSYLWIHVRVGLLGRVAKMGTEYIYL